MFGSQFKKRLPEPTEALPSRSASPFPVPTQHAVLGTDIGAPAPDGFGEFFVGMGCFWGAERDFWTVPGVWTTAVGYAGGVTAFPTYDEVCSGRTGHTEAVRVVYDPSKVTFPQLLKVFWESHDPTTGYRQGNDVGTQYRSAIYTTTDEQLATARLSREQYQVGLTAGGFGPITTEIVPVKDFFYAETDHQQYLHKVPWGYCGHGETGVSCPIGLGVPANA
jgi:peptide-methionine (S)-S-oxide reductase